MNKNVMLFIDSDESTIGKHFYFDTVAEAQTYAESHQGALFEIFTLYTRGEIAGITWNLATDAATNLRENKKAASQSILRGGKWSPLEVRTLIESKAAKMPITKIAEKLNRSYNSCYLKLQKLKKK